MVLQPDRVVSLVGPHDVQVPIGAHRDLREELAGVSAVVVDLLDDFQREIHTQQLYFAIDGHLTHVGHAAAHRMLRTSIASREDAVRPR